MTVLSKNLQLIVGVVGKNKMSYDFSETGWPNHPSFRSLPCRHQLLIVLLQGTCQTLARLRTLWRNWLRSSMMTSASEISWKRWSAPPAPASKLKSVWCVLTFLSEITLYFPLIHHSSSCNFILIGTLLVIVTQKKFCHYLAMLMDRQNSEVSLSMEHFRNITSKYYCRIFLNNQVDGV